MTHRWPFNTDFNDLLGSVPAVPHGTVSLDGQGNAVTGSPLTFTATGTPDVANKLVVHTQPSTTETAGTALAQQPAVYIEDQYGNLETADTTTVVTATRGNHGTTTLTGTTTATATGGIIRVDRMKNSRSSASGMRNREKA